MENETESQNGSVSEGPISTPGFWRRQIKGEPTRMQMMFDWSFGVILPIICAAADPLVFRGSGLGKGPILGSAKTFAYVLSIVSILAMAAWLLRGNKIKWLGTAFAGLFIVGAVISGGIGLLISPLSLIGIALNGIGLLGFVPIFSAFVFLRNGIRAFAVGRSVLAKRLVIPTFVFSAIAAFTIPFAINCEVNRYLDEMVSGDAETIYQHLSYLKYIAPIVNADRLGGEYCQSPDSDEHIALADAYLKLSGESIENIDWHICDDWSVLR